MLCPQVVDEPLSHHKCTFVTVGIDVDYDAFDEVKVMTKRLNAGLRDSRVHHELS
jgi:hypothetical protein